MSDSCATCAFVRVAIDPERNEIALECHLEPPDPAFPVLEQVQVQDHEIGLEAAGIDIEDEPAFDPVPQQRYPHVDETDWCSHHEPAEPQGCGYIAFVALVGGGAVGLLMAVLIIVHRLALAA